MRQLYVIAMCVYLPITRDSSVMRQRYVIAMCVYLPITRDSSVMRQLYVMAMYVLCLFASNLDYQPP